MTATLSESRIAQVRSALQEDIGSGDLTADLIAPDVAASARIIARESAVLCGRQWVDEVFRQVDAAIQVDWAVADGDELVADQPVCEIRGPARALLSGERCALNFLQTLSATATLAARYVAAVSGTAATILDTRKTIPGLRLAQKYAVRCGGASNHRVGLYDAILIKENHIRAAGSIKAALQAAAIHRGVPIEVEVESLDELDQAIAAGARRILLDNFANAELRAAVRMTNGQALLEASGGVSLQTVRGIAETGVDFISVGQLTKNIAATDYSMLFATEGQPPATEGSAIRP
jgi:nicotinate-nucleotide pyrophosphorylase (carboxylating)